MQLLNDNGHLCYITSNKWMRAKYGEKLRGFFKDKTQLKQIIDFEGQQIFENATVDTNILLCGKTANTQPDFAYQKKLPDDNNPLFNMAIGDLSANAYTLQAPEILALKKKIEQIGTPLKDWDINIYRGVLTGFNEAFIISTAKRDELITQDPKSTEIIKPILRGRDIKAYQHHWAGLWLIATFPVLKINIDHYPAIKNHLLSFSKDRLEQAGKRLPDGKKSRKKTGNKWFETQDQIGYYEEFAKEKIVYGQFREGSYHFTSEHLFLSSNEYMITSKITNLKYLVSLLNSKVAYFYLYMSANNLSGNTSISQKSIFINSPIPQISKSAQQPFIALVDKILTAKQQGKDTSTLESKIDEMVYRLYSLTDEEVRIVEKKV